MKTKYLNLIALTGAFFGFASGMFAQCPTISCPGNITVNNAPSTCGAVVNFTDPIGTNPCSAPNTVSFSYTGSIVTWTVPAGITTISIQAKGAQGGYNTSSGIMSGLGATMSGDFAVTPGDQLKILVGEQPSASAGNGGGGGTFVTDILNNPLIIAGGGGGSSQSTDSPDKNGQIGTTGGTGASGGGLGGLNGNGGNVGPSGFQSGAGGGLLTNGVDGWTTLTGGLAFVNGGSGGSANANAHGGFGGGGSGSSYVVGGGGGGYSGGGSGGNNNGGVGGGGGSFNSGTNQINSSGTNSGHGSITITYIPTVTTTQISGLISGSNFPIGTTTQTFQVDDGLGNQSTCSFTVIVSDNEMPVITAPSNITVSNDNGICGAVVTYNAPVGTDNCSGAITAFTSGIGSGGTFPVGTSTEVYTVTDGSGNTASCSFTITVNDMEAPVINCPSPIQVNNDTGLCYAIVNYNVPVATDNCSGATTVLISGLGSGASFPIGTTMESYQATDASGNISTCQFAVTVSDGESPVFTCNTNVQSCDQLVTGIAPSYTDNCAGNDNVLYNLSGATTGSGTNDASGTTFNIGVTTVQYIVTDSSGNSDTCYFDVTVFAPPVITASASSLTPCVDDGAVTLSATPTGGTWTGIGVTGNMFDPATAGIGAQTLTYSVTDTNGCSASTDVIITVNACTGIHTENLQNVVSVYPNPNDGSFTINVSADGIHEMQMQIVDLQGRVVYAEIMEGINAGFTKNVNLTSLANGAYYMKFTSANSTLTEKLIIQK